MNARTTKICLVAAAALLVTTGCIARGRMKHENGPRVEQPREVAPYTAISTSSGIDVAFSDDLEGGRIVVVAGKKMQERIATEVVAGELKIYMRPSSQFWVSTNGIKVVVPNTGSVTRLVASGGSDILADRVTLRGSSLSVECSGGADFKGNVAVGKLAVNCSGGADFKGDVTADACSLSASGGSDITVSGSSKECAVSISGGSDLHARDFEVVNYALEASGGSDATVLCTGHLTALAEGGSDVRYAGGCGTTISDDVSSSVKPRR